MSYLNYFGFTCTPFHKSNPHIWAHDEVNDLEDKFRRLIEVPGVGLITGAPGVGKTSTLNYVMDRIKGPKVKYIYLCETDFSRNEIYMVLADKLGIDHVNKRSVMWRHIKTHIMHMRENQGITPVVVIDEAHNLPDAFFRDLPSFLNFNMDSQDPLVLWLMGTPKLSNKLRAPAFEALESRIRLWHTVSAITDFNVFKDFISHGFKQAGAKANIISETGLNTMFEACKGRPRAVSNIIINALQKSAMKECKHIPDDILEQAILETR
jgi:MSHA biogenesis protein MshM